MEMTQKKEWEDLLVLTKKMPPTKILVVDQAKDPLSPASFPWKHMMRVLPASKDRKLRRFLNKDATFNGI